MATTAGEATFSLPRAQFDGVPSFYVRVFSPVYLRFQNEDLGFEFGSTLRPLSTGGDSWSLQP